MGQPLPGIELRVDDGELQLRTASCPTFFSHYLGARAVRRRVVADRRPRPRRRRRLPLVRGPRRRPDPLRPATGSARSRSSRRSSPTRRSPRPRRSPAPDAERGAVVRAIVVLRRRRARRRARRASFRSTSRADGALQVPADRRVRRLAAEDGERQDQARGAARGGRRRAKLAPDGRGARRPPGRRSRRSSPSPCSSCSASARRCRSCRST